MTEQQGNPVAREKIALTEKRGGILGVKAGMTQVFNENGEAIAVTVIDLRPNVITQIKSMDKDGYVAVQVGIGEKKEKASNKPEIGHAKKVGVAGGFRHYEEFRLDAKAKMDGLEIGKTLSADFLKVGDLVDLTSISKGKGFQGTMKKYHYAGGHKTHGASVSHRSLGSIGNRADPGKVFKGKKMPGQMGNMKTTVQNVPVAQLNQEEGILLVHGSVPGPKSSLVRIQLAVKRMGAKKAVK